ncbi:MAG: PilW family protein [Betaproteobacteria bacterium]|nr:PilW family protein [Betaproteobacteria bacterium]
MKSCLFPGKAIVLSPIRQLAIALERVPRSSQNQKGLSLVELMIAVTIGLIILATLTVVFSNGSNARRELEKSGSMLENGHYALAMLNDDLSQAGNYGELSVPTGTTDLPCSTAVSDWAASLAIPVHGSNQGDLSIPCVSRKANTDAIFIQRASTCIAGTAGCAAMVANAAYLQVSGCGDEYLTTPFVLAINSGNPYTLKAIQLPGGVGQQPTCQAAGTAPVRYFYRSIYYVDSNNILWRLDVNAGSTATPPGTPVQIASNVENMQLEYGIDSSGDGAPDTFSSTPAATDWPNVVGVRISLLVLAGNSTSGYQDAKSYVFGDVCSLPPGSTTCPVPYAANAPIIRSTTDQAYKRHVYTSYVSFINPVGRREQ